MQQVGATLAPFYEGWRDYQGMLVEALAPLTSEQLALRASPDQRPIWLLAAHIIGTRVGWFQNVMGEGDPTLASFDPWDTDGAPPRAATELIHGLEATWHMIQGCLDRWTPAMLNDSFTRERGDQSRSRTRQWILWHIIEHDLHHGGELCLTLGIHGLPTPDL